MKQTGPKPHQKDWIREHDRLLYLLLENPLEFEREKRRLFDDMSMINRALQERRNILQGIDNTATV